MSLEWMGHVWTADFRSSAKKLVALVIADCHNAETGQCNPGPSYIAKRTNLSVGNVRKHLTDLVDEGFFDRDERGNWSLGFEVLQQLTDATGPSYSAARREAAARRSARSSAQNCAAERAEVRADARRSARVTGREPEVEPEEEPSASAALDAEPSTDLVHVAAEVVERPQVPNDPDGITRFAWDRRKAERGTVPVCAGGFVALRANVARLLEGGEEPRLIALAIYHNDGAWTLAALQEQMRQIRARVEGPKHRDTPSDQLARVAAMMNGAGR